MQFNAQAQETREVVCNTNPKVNQKKVFAKREI